jgi:hypothetical protein
MRGLPALPMAALAGVAVVANPQQQTFKRNVEGVRLDVRVVDKDGRLLRDLTRDDIVVSEDGKDQTTRPTRPAGVRPHRPSSRLRRRQTTIRAKS